VGIHGGVAPRRTARIGDLTPFGLQKLARRFWPGPITLIAARREGGGTVGLRVPAHKVALAVLKEVGSPLLLTSANRSGEPDARDAQEAARALDGHVGLILDGGPAQLGEASAVVSFEGTRALIHREGMIDRAMIRRVAARHVLLVCSGNTCRSPMAEHLMRALWAGRSGSRRSGCSSSAARSRARGPPRSPRMPASEEGRAAREARHRPLSPPRAAARRRHGRAADHVFAMTTTTRAPLRRTVPSGGRIDLARTGATSPTRSRLARRLSGCIALSRRSAQSAPLRARGAAATHSGGPDRAWRQTDRLQPLAHARRSRTLGFS
jgi:protein-tyrosine-phosphatase